MTLIAILILLLGAFGVGDGLVRLVVRREEFHSEFEPLFALILRVILGAGLLGMAAMLGVVCGILPRPVAVLVILASAIAGLWRLISERNQWCRPAALDLVGGTVLAMFTIFMMAATWFPVLQMDSYAYHYTVPKQWMIHRGFVVANYEVCGNFYLLWSGWLYWGIALVPDDLLFPRQMVLLSAAGCALVLMLELRRRGHPRSGWLLAFAWMVQEDAFELFVQDYMDMPMALMFLLGCFVTARTLDSVRCRRMLILAGVFFGCAIGMKITAMFFGTLAGMAFIGSLGWRRTPPRVVVSHAMCLAIPAILLWLPWAIKNAIITGNPVYPFFIDLFPEKPQFGQSARDFLGSYGYGQHSTLFEKVLGGGALVRDYLRNAGYLQTNLVTSLFAVTSLIALLRRRFPAESQFLVLLGLLLLMPAIFLQAKRFVLVATAVHALVLVQLVARWFQSRPVWHRNAVGVMGILVLCWSAHRGFIGRLQGVLHTELIVPRALYLTSDEMRKTAYPLFPQSQTAVWIDENLGPDDRLLVTYHLMINAIARIRIQSNPHLHGKNLLRLMTEDQGRTADGLRDQLREWGITAILTEDSMEDGTLKEFREKFLQPVTDEGAPNAPFELYRIQ